MTIKAPAAAFAALAMTLMAPAAASAAVTVNAVTAVPGSASDPFIALGAVSPTESLDLVVSQIISLQQPGPQYFTNAAGVLTSTGSGFGSNGNPGDFNDFGPVSPGCPLSTPCTFGALLVTLTTQGGVDQTVQLFDPTTHGAGNPTPPTTLTYSGTLGGLFSSFTSADTNGKLTFSIADSFYTDNTGAFSVSVAPEPSTWLLLLAGIGVLGATLRLGRRGELRELRNLSR